MNIVVFGFGAMGKILCEDIAQKKDMNLLAAIEKDDQKRKETKASFPVSGSLKEVSGKIDSIIDFSHPANLDEILHYATAHQTALVACTTGYSDKQINQIIKAGEKTAVLFSRNMSLGVNLISEILKKITPVLSETFDIEIIEKHHNQKIDAPSGTAGLFLDSINEKADHEKKARCGREGMVGKRPENEVGIHSIRGGSLVGEHSVIFAGQDEIIEISHQALSKRIFSQGSIKAARFLYGKKPGFYSMNDVLKI